MSGGLVGIAIQVMVLVIIVSIVILFAGIGILVLMHVCIVGRAFRRALRNMARGDRCIDSSNGLSPDELAKLPCYEFKPGEKSSGPTDCAVCLESFQTGESCRLLPLCKHSFHRNCVDSWLLRAPVCPICRTCVDNSKGEKAVETQHEGFIGGVGFELREAQ